MRDTASYSDETPNEASAPSRFQFSLGTLLLVVLYGGLLATLVVNFVGEDWKTVQIAAAYVVTLALVLGLALLSKARARILDYAIFGPLIFIAAATVGGLLVERPQAKTIPTTTPATTVTAPFVQPAHR